MSKLPPPLCLSPISCIHSLALKTSPLAPQQLFACISTWFQCLSFPPCLSTTSCAHLVSISNFPPVPLIKLPNLPKLPAFIGFQYLYFPRSLPITSCVHFVLISKLPPRCPTTTSCIHLASTFPVPPWPPKVPPTCASPQLPAVSISQLPSSLHSFLHAPSFGFNI